MQIKTTDLSHTYALGTISEFTALKNVSVTFSLGEFIAIIGHTGSGKTTLIEHLNGLLRPTRGRVAIGEIVIEGGRRRPAKIKISIRSVNVSELFFSLLSTNFFEETIEKDIIFGPRNMGVPLPRAQALAKEYIKLVGLPEEYLQRSPFALSGGQKRRVALAGILAMEPDILIFDEPTAGLDPEGSREMYGIFKQLNAKGKTIVVVTHDLDKVLSYVKRTIVLRHGQVARDGNTLDVLYDHAFLIENELEPPKLVSLVGQLESCGLKIGRVSDLSQLVRRIKLARGKSMNSVTIGKYIPGNSFVHRLDPRVKLLINILLIVLVFLTSSLIMQTIFLVPIFVAFLFRICAKVCCSVL
ncbi:ATP-binding cassette domain-containing protein [Mycoplasma sp. ATU-Cv-508]|uniref:ATP-binding cassette domain-containing protein n=1 Tax=Mycoplasma sp. ATU-Cv-508 TaxID=2048001 RepID=UPI001F0049CB